MKLEKIGKTFHVKYKTLHGTKSTTTKATELSEAKRIVKDAGIAELEHAARAGRLTQQVVGQIMTGKKLTLAKAIAEFADWQRSVNKSQRTIENNAWVFKVWLEWNAHLATVPPSAITEKQISPFVNQKNEREGAVARNLKLIAIKNLFDFCAAKGWSAGNPATLVRVNYDLLSHEQKERTAVVPFTESEYRRLVNHLREEIAECEKEVKRLSAPHRTVDNTPHLATYVKRLANRRFWLIAVHLDWETGLRIADIAQLEWESLAITGKVIVWTRKRTKRVAVPLPKATENEIWDLLSQVRSLTDRYVFPEQRLLHRDAKLRAGLSIQFSRIAQRAGIKGKSFHSLRHSFVTRMKKEGKTLEDIGVLVGHSSAKTTARYAHE